MSKKPFTFLLDDNLRIKFHEYKTNQLKKNTKVTLTSFIHEVLNEKLRSSK